MPSSSSVPSPRHAVIVGAGLAGSLLACYLAQDGWSVDVFERRGDPRAKGYAGGRSINLALSARGFWGLAGVEDRTAPGRGLDSLVIERDAIPMRGRMIHPPPPTPAHPATLVFQPYSSNPADAINSVSRGGLNLTLLNAAADMPGVRLFFDHPCVDVDLDEPAAILQRPAGDLVHAPASIVIGADGAFSAVRLRLMKVDRFDYSQSYLSHGYKELLIPPARDLTGPSANQRHDGFAIDPNALHIWPRGSSMMIALPNRDASFTCTLFWPFDGPLGLTSLRSPSDVTAFFNTHYPDALPLMPSLARDYAANPIGSLVTVRCFPWQHAGKVAILGDAAHAVVPFYGQGMNCAFEDCRVLARCLAEHPRDHAAALDAFQHDRKPNADAIADMALENFIEMRDKVADPAFRYRKRVEQTLHKAFPAHVFPQYNLVSFSTVPYTEARRRGRELDAVLDNVIAQVPPSASPVDLPAAQWESLIRRAGAAALGTP
ncbi:MAG: FAD-dependent oxidoreductase [Phycisphaerales bacterium]